MGEEGGLEDDFGRMESEYRLRDVDDDNDDDDDGDDLFSNNLEEPLLFDDYNMNMHDDTDADDISIDNFEDNDLTYTNTSIRKHREHAQATKSITEKEKKDNIWRIASSIAIFWSGAAVACCVKDIDVVWDFLGGSLSLIMGFLIPSGAFLVLYAKVVRILKYRINDDIEMHGVRGGGGGVEDTEMEPMSLFDKVMAWALIIIFIPMMFTLTGNAVYNLGSDS